MKNMQRMLVVILTLLTATGCAREHRGDDTSEQVWPTFPDDATEQQLYKAEQILIHNCMKAFGLYYGITDAQAAGGDRDFPFGIDDPEWATTHGIGNDLRALREAAIAADKTTSYFEGLPASQKSRALTLLFGDDSARMTYSPPDGGVITKNSNGCQGQSESRLYGDSLAYFRGSELKNYLSIRTMSRVQDDSLYRATLAKWSTCMLARGYRVESPQTLRRLLPSSSNQLRATPKEMQAGGAEAACTLETDLSATGWNRYRAIGADSAAPFARELQTLASAQQHAISLLPTIANK